MTNVETMEVPREAQANEHKAQADQVERKAEERFEKLLNGPRMNSFGARQMQLALEMFIKENPEEELDHKKANEVILAWSDATRPGPGYSKKWREMVDDNPKFNEHKRLQGNYANVTLDDFLKFVKTGEFPKE